MTHDEYRNELEDLLDGMSDDDIIALHNNVAGDYEDANKIHYMTEFDDIINTWYTFAPSDLIRSLDPEFDLNDYYFVVDDLNNIYSFTDLLDIHSPWDRDACITYIMDYGESFGDSDIQDIIDRWDLEGEG